MDQGLPEAPKTVRWLAWVVGCLLLAGLLSAGILVAAGDRPGSAVVTAAGDRTTIDVTSTVTVPVPPSSTPTTVPTTTTLPRAAMDVLNAITTTTTRSRATTTTRPPVATTTVPTPTPTTAAPSTTSTTVPRFTVTLVNNHPHAFVLVVNGREFPLEPGQTTEPVDLPVARGDLIQVRLPEDPKNCGVSDSGVIFQPGARYRVTIVTGPGMCGSFASPLLEILRLP